MMCFLRHIKRKIKPSSKVCVTFLHIYNFLQTQNTNTHCLEAAINANNPAPDDIEANSLHVDSDEETDLIMAAVARSNPQPLVYYNPVPVRRRYQYIRMTNLLGQALRPIVDPPISATSNFLTGHGFTASPTISSPVSNMMGRPSFPTPSQQAATRRLSVVPAV